MQGVLSGRLLAYHPKNQKTTVVADGFLFSNGVAVAADGSFVAVVETSAVRIWKIWLMGEKARFAVHCQSAEKGHRYKVALGATLLMTPCGWGEKLYG